ncbi:MAG: hypothetical protein M1840_006296 [Geoglossum simile]|nr:MAG: hypothetical protein M1840_006296 [Geoglossum simile]
MRVISRVDWATEKSVDKGRRDWRFSVWTSLHEETDDDEFRRFLRSTARHTFGRDDSVLVMEHDPPEWIMKMLLNDSTLLSLRGIARHTFEDADSVLAMEPGLLRRFTEPLFNNHVRRHFGGRSIRCHRFSSTVECDGRNKMAMCILKTPTSWGCDPAASFQAAVGPSCSAKPSAGGNRAPVIRKALNKDVTPNVETHLQPSPPAMIRWMVEIRVLR